eukprot:15463557-Alexandrium_andersonii.AAC.1
MDALLLAPRAILEVLREEGARDRTSDLLWEGVSSASAEPVVDVARGPAGTLRSKVLYVVQPSRVQDDHRLVR